MASETGPHCRKFYCGDAPQEDSGGVSVNVEQSSVRPVVMQCPQCGGSLKLTAQSERTVPCSFCGVDVYLPDGLWKKLDPVKTKKQWYVCFQGVPLAELEEQRKRQAQQEEQNKPIEAANNWKPPKSASYGGMPKWIEWAIFIGMGVGIPGLVFGIRHCHKKRIQKEINKARKGISSKMPDISSKVSGQFEVSHPQLGKWTLKPTACW